MLNNTTQPLFDFKEISKEVFETRCTQQEKGWEDLIVKENDFDLDEAWKVFIEDIQAFKVNNVSHLNEETVLKFEQAYQDYFYEGGQEAYQNYLTKGTTLRYNQSAIDYFVHLYETQLTKEKYLKPKDDKVAALVKNKDYKGLSAHLQEGIKNYLKGDTFKNYLRFLAQFHQYSEKNIRLILAQNENASHVASFKKWKEMNNPIKKGEKAIYIYAPRKKVEKDAQGNIVKDDKGEPVTTSYFVLVPVFDVSQTMHPELLPRPLYALPDNFEHPQHFYELYKGLCALSPVPVVLEELPEETHGYYSPTEQKIALHLHQGEAMTIKTLIHEITHACLHANAQVRFGDENYRRQEFEAESVAYVMMNHLGIDSGDYSFGYLSSWTNEGKKIEDFQDSLETIARQSEHLIQKLEKVLSKSYGLVVPQNEFEKRLKEARTPQAKREVPTVKKGSQETKETTPNPKAQRPLKHSPNGRQNKIKA
ncbi:ArdC-like ssDNA-binding domain-containing protein [Lactococcus petauri]|uniref:ArdC-like ssDNA-binding domain-containing protein n=1 Tax=Lactococcus petauri TaxID=1940789 RepID=UPI001F57B2E9|nr:ArdC-like ssDNA-binding domain-containing protein [Lactococcus petauri]